MVLLPREKRTTKQGGSVHVTAVTIRALPFLLTTKNNSIMEDLVYMGVVTLRNHYMKKNVTCELYSREDTDGVHTYLIPERRYNEYMDYEVSPTIIDAIL